MPVGNDYADEKRRYRNDAHDDGNYYGSSRRSSSYYYDDDDDNGRRYDNTRQPPRRRSRYNDDDDDYVFRGRNRDDFQYSNLADYDNDDDDRSRHYRRRSSTGGGSKKSSNNSTSRSSMISSEHQQHRESNRGYPDVINHNDGRRSSTTSITDNSSSSKRDSSTSFRAAAAAAAEGGVGEERNHDHRRGGDDDYEQLPPRLDESKAMFMSNMPFGVTRYALADFLEERLGRPIGIKRIIYDTAGWGDRNVHSSRKKINRSIVELTDRRDVDDVRKLHKSLWGKYSLKIHKYEVKRIALYMYNVHKLETLRDVVAFLEWKLCRDIYIHSWNFQHSSDHQNITIEVLAERDADDIVDLNGVTWRNRMLTIRRKEAPRKSTILAIENLDIQQSSSGDEEELVRFLQNHFDQHSVTSHPVKFYKSRILGKRGSVAVDMDIRDDLKSILGSVAPYRGKLLALKSSKKHENESKERPTDQSHGHYGPTDHSTCVASVGGDSRQHDDDETAAHVVHISNIPRTNEPTYYISTQNALRDHLRQSIMASFQCENVEFRHVHIHPVHGLPDIAKGFAHFLDPVHANYATMLPTESKIFRGVQLSIESRSSKESDRLHVNEDGTNPVPSQNGNLPPGDNSNDSVRESHPNSSSSVHENEAMTTEPRDSIHGRIVSTPSVEGESRLTSSTPEGSLVYTTDIKSSRATANTNEQSMVGSIESGLVVENETQTETGNSAVPPDVTNTDDVATGDAGDDMDITSNGEEAKELQGACLAITAQKGTNTNNAGDDHCSKTDNEEKIQTSPRGKETTKDCKGIGAMSEETPVHQSGGPDTSATEQQQALPLMSETPIGENESLNEKTLQELISQQDNEIRLLRKRVAAMQEGPGPDSELENLRSKKQKLLENLETSRTAFEKVSNALAEITTASFEEKRELRKELEDEKQATARFLAGPKKEYGS